MQEFKAATYRWVGACVWACMLNTILLGSPPTTTTTHTIAEMRQDGGPWPWCPCTLTSAVAWVGAASREHLADMCAWRRLLLGRAASGQCALTFCAVSSAGPSSGVDQGAVGQHHC
jgi:hypothetical protein